MARTQSTAVDQEQWRQQQAVELEAALRWSQSRAAKHNQLAQQLLSASPGWDAARSVLAWVGTLCLLFGAPVFTLGFARLADLPTPAALVPGLLLGAGLVVTGLRLADPSLFAALIGDRQDRVQWVGWALIGVAALLGGYATDSSWMLGRIIVAGVGGLLAAGLLLLPVHTVLGANRLRARWHRARADRATHQSQYLLGLRTEMDQAANSAPRTDQAGSAHTPSRAKGLGAGGGGLQ